MRFLEEQNVWEEGALVGLWAQGGPGQRSVEAQKEHGAQEEVERKEGPGC